MNFSTRFHAHAAFLLTASLLVGMATVVHGHAWGSPRKDDILPRTKRKRKRAKEDRGLPPDNDLKELAERYLSIQRRLFPALAAAGVIPEATDEVIAAMVADFKSRHHGASPSLKSIAEIRRHHRKLGGFYARYSCEGSTSKSILDQMEETLPKAAADGYFIPWQYVYADYSVTGQDPARRGYVAYKKVFASPEQSLSVTYIWDFHRASRNDIDWWKLAYLARKPDKGLKGADGFDVHSEDYELRIGMYSLFSRLFLKALRRNVRRGMKGAQRRGTCLGKLPIGFARCVARDVDGNILMRNANQKLYRPFFDNPGRKVVRLIFRLFLAKKWSAYAIAVYLNGRRSDDWDRWTESSVKKILKNPAYIGVFIWNMYRREYDLELEKWVRIKNPKSEWIIYYDPKLRLIPMSWYRDARRRLASGKRGAAHKKSRNQLSATTLFSGTLVCEYCEDEEIKLIRSTESYKQMGCVHGPAGIGGCKLTTSKSARIIENSLLAFIRDSILTESRLKDICKQANEHLAKEAAKPRKNLKPLQSKIKSKQRSIDKLVLQVENEDGALCDGYHRRIKQLQAEVNTLRVEFSEEERRNVVPPPPLDLDRVATYVADLRSVLNLEVPVAADAIRSLTGPISIRQETISGRSSGARWIATFSPNFLRILAKLGRERDYPDSITLEYLSTAIWTNSTKVEVEIHKIPQYELLADEFRRMHAQGMSINAMAAAKKMAWKQANGILQFAIHGQKPKWPAKKKKNAPSESCQSKVTAKAIADTVVNLVDNEELSIPHVAERLGCSENTARRAYYLGRPDVVEKACETGGKLPSRRHRFLGKEKHLQIRKLLEEGQEVKQIAETLGVGQNTVRRARAVMQKERLGEGELPNEPEN